METSNPTMKKDETTKETTSPTIECVEAQSIQDYYTKYRSMFVQSAVKARLSREDAEDIVQDVFMRLLTSKKMINKITLPAMAYTTLQNLLKDRWRHQAYIRQHEQYVVHAASQNVGKAFCSSSENAMSLASMHETELLLQKSLARLDEKSCRIYRMNLEEGKQVSEIAEFLQMNYKTVENRLGAARKEVRKRMRAAL